MKRKDEISGLFILDKVQIRQNQSVSFQWYPEAAGKN